MDPGADGAALALVSAPVDVCVVGAGAGGAVAAWALVRQGISVTLLEAGPRFDPDRHPTHAAEAELGPTPIEEVADDPESISYEAPPGEPLDPKFSQLASRSPSHFVRRGWARRLPFYHSRAIGVGGSTLHYQGEAHRFPSHAFRMRSERGVAEDWPLGYADLAPFYERVESLLGVAGDPANPFKPPRGPYPYPAHPLSPLSRRIGSAAQKLGLRLLPNPVAILPQPRQGRAACHYCNGCTRGCAVGAKGSVDVAVIPQAEGSGLLRVVTGFRASHLEHDPTRRITGVLGFDRTGALQRIRARAFVLAAGAIETPRILWNSAGGAHPQGIGNDHGELGRHLMETLYVSRRGLADLPLQTYAGIPLDSRIWDGNGASGAGDLPNGFVLGQGCGGLLGPAAYALKAVDGLGAAHRRGMRSAFGRGFGLLGIAEQLPRAENRVTLSERSDRFGVPLARVATRLDRDDLRVLAAMWRRLGELAGAAGFAEPEHQLSAYDVPQATHVAGTCRMGSDPSRSVLDAFGAVHGVPNLVVADASALVTQGAGDSPSLTIQALALRSAEALAQRARHLEV